MTWRLTSAWRSYSLSSSNSERKRWCWIDHVRRLEDGIRRAIERGRGNCFTITVTVRDKDVRRHALAVWLRVLCDAEMKMNDLNGVIERRGAARRGDIGVRWLTTGSWVMSVKWMYVESYAPTPDIDSRDPQFSSRETRVCQLKYQLSRINYLIKVAGCVVSLSFHSNLREPLTTQFGLYIHCGPWKCVSQQLIVNLSNL